MDVVVAWARCAYRRFPTQPRTTQAQAKPSYCATKRRKFPLAAGQDLARNILGAIALSMLVGISLVHPCRKPK